MALLSEAERKQYFKELGLGEYNQAGILALQKKYLLRKSDWDGIYGTNTDNLLRHLKAVKDNCINFAPEEFRCGCNGRFCCGYPTYMKPAELANIQSIRTHYGKPMSITCGVRCVKYNREVGGITKSEHLYGSAADYYIQGVTDTLANRKSSIKWIKKLPNHHYTYGNGINSNGAYVSAPGMGNCMHTDSYDAEPGPAPTPTPPGKLVEDGIGGPATVEAMQRFFDTLVDGVISGQVKAQKYYYPSLTAVKFNKVKSTCVMKLQEWVGVEPDGILGRDTCLAWQGKLLAMGYDIGKWGADGIFGADSMRAWQRFLNGDEPTPTPTPDPQPTPSKDYTDVIDISEMQSSIDFAKVKAAGIVGAIVRCGFRGYEKGTLKEDAKFMQYIKGAYAAGLKVGVYFFTEAINYEEGKEEAEYTLKLIDKAGVPLYYPIAVDTEKINAKGVRANDLTKAQRTEAIRGFCEGIKAHGGTPMIYASTSWLNNQLDMSKLPYDVWCAQYYKECQYKGKYVMWQYTSEGKVNGISGVVDMNKCYIKDAAPEPAPAPTPAPYTGSFPTAEEMRSATNFGMMLRATIWAEDIAAKNQFGYRKYGDGSTKCILCHPELVPDWSAKHIEDASCIGWAAQFWHHGAGIVAMKCSQNWVNNAKIEKALKMSDADCLAFFRKATGLQDIKVLRNAGKVIPWDRLKRGMICFIFDKNGYSHTAPYIGNKQTVDSGSWSDWNKQIAKRSMKQPKIAIEYTGGLPYLQMYDRGEAVRKLQDILNHCGSYNLDTDGIFGSGTEKAVKDFQGKNGLVADGLAGQATFAKLKEIVG